MVNPVSANGCKYNHQEQICEELNYTPIKQPDEMSPACPPPVGEGESITELRRKLGKQKIVVNHEARPVVGSLWAASANPMQVQPDKNASVLLPLAAAVLSRNPVVIGGVIASSMTGCVDSIEGPLAASPLTDVINIGDATSSGIVTAKVIDQSLCYDAAGSPILVATQYDADFTGLRASINGAALSLLPSDDTLFQPKAVFVGERLVASMIASSSSGDEDNNDISLQLVSVNPSDNSDIKTISDFTTSGVKVYANELFTMGEHVMSVALMDNKILINQYSSQLNALANSKIDVSGVTKIAVAKLNDDGDWILLTYSPQGAYQLQAYMLKDETVQSGPTDIASFEPVGKPYLLAAGMDGKAHVIIGSENSSVEYFTLDSSGSSSQSNTVPLAKPIAELQLAAHPAGTSLLLTSINGGKLNGTLLNPITRSAVDTGDILKDLAPNAEASRLAVAANANGFTFSYLVPKSDNEQVELFIRTMTLGE